MYAAEGKDREKVIDYCILEGLQVDATDVVSFSVAFSSFELLN